MQRGNLQRRRSQYNVTGVLALWAGTLRHRALNNTEEDVSFGELAGTDTGEPWAAIESCFGIPSQQLRGFNVISYLKLLYTNATMGGHHKRA